MSFIKQTNGTSHMSLHILTKNFRTTMFHISHDIKPITLNYTQSPIKSNHFFVAVVTVYMVDVVIVSVVVCVTVAVFVIVAVPFFFVFGCRCCFKMSCFCFPAPVSSLFPSRWSMLGLSIEIWKWGGVERNLFQLTLPSFYCYAL